MRRSTDSGVQAHIDNVREARAARRRPACMRWHSRRERPDQNPLPHAPGEAPLDAAAGTSGSPRDRERAGSHQQSKPSPRSDNVVVREPITRERQPALLTSEVYSGRWQQAWRRDDAPRRQIRYRRRHRSTTQPCPQSLRTAASPISRVPSRLRAGRHTPWRRFATSRIRCTRSAPSRPLSVPTSAPYVGSACGDPPRHVGSLDVLALIPRLHLPAISKGE
jgi:hypothetical protein